MRKYKIYCQECKQTIGIIGIQPNTIVRYLDGTRIISSRFRFDKTWGFQCVCGNDSRLAKAERGIITAAPPTMDELKKLNAKFKTVKTKVERDGNKITCDGFVMELADA